MESIEQVVCGQPLDHAHKLLDARSDTFTIENCHQVVYQRFLIWQSNPRIHTLSSEFIQHGVLVLVDLEFPVNMLRICLQVHILILEQVVDAHRYDTLEDDLRSAEGLIIILGENELFLKDVVLVWLVKQALHLYHGIARLFLCFSDIGISSMCFLAKATRLRLTRMQGNLTN